MTEFDDLLNDLPKFTASQALQSQIITALQTAEPDKAEPLDEPWIFSEFTRPDTAMFTSKTAIGSFVFALVFGIVVGMGNISSLSQNYFTTTNNQTLGDYSDIENFQIIAPEILETNYG